MNKTAAPTFELPPCPACSNMHALNRPQWHLAARTSKRDGKPTYGLMGCRHAEAVGKGKFYADPADWERLEKDWADVCETLFDIKTQTWEEEKSQEYRRKLDDRPWAPREEQIALKVDAPEVNDQARPEDEAKEEDVPF